jgi:hypothetical protein
MVTTAFGSLAENVMIWLGRRCWPKDLPPSSPSRSAPARVLEGTHPLDVAVSDGPDRLLARRLVVAQRGQRVPERGAADGEADEPRLRRRRAQPGDDAGFIGAAPENVQPTLSRPSRCAAVTTAAQSSRRSSPSIFQTSGSTPAFCNSLIAAIISDGRRSWS